MVCDLLLFSNGKSKLADTASSEAIRAEQR
jgi:hypothetical protein